MALFMDLVALSNGLHGSVQMDSVALFSWIGWLRHHGIFNNKTGVSDLYSLDDFSPRKSENIQKGYLQGRYGAMPVVNFKDIEW